MIIGERVRKARKRKGFTQAQLAEKVGIKQSTISELEKGDSTSSSYIARIAAVLDVMPLWLETGKGPEQPPTGNGSHEGEIDRLLLLIESYKKAGPEGRDAILETAIEYFHFSGDDINSDKQGKLREVVADKLCRMMKADLSLNTLDKLEKKSKVRGVND